MEHIQRIKKCYIPANLPSIWARFEYKHIQQALYTCKFHNYRSEIFNYQ